MDKLILLLIGLGILSVGFYCYALGTPIDPEDKEEGEP